MTRSLWVGFAALCLLAGSGWALDEVAPGLLHGLLRVAVHYGLLAVVFAVVSLRTQTKQDWLPWGKLALGAIAVFGLPQVLFAAAGGHVAGTTALLVHEADLGGSVAEVAVTDGCGAAIVAGPTPSVNPTSVVTFDPTTGKVLATVLGPTPGYDLQGLAWRGGALYVGDRRSGPGGYALHVLSNQGACSLVETPTQIILPQPPVALRAAGGP